ncbi:MAG: redox-sensing transcriptional repressor Rex [Oscillospiraceae bacterium]|nr:redox-sensing transcriptional repressor Rex [Oscillospiraceae bacterium]
MCNSSVSKATLGRVPQYLKFLKELPKDSFEYISATYIAKELELGEVQVRKDLNAISGAGKPKRGYVTEELIHKLEDSLGYNNITSAALVGAGKLGRALLDYGGFQTFGVKITAAFDCNETALYPGGRVKILPITQFEEYCKANRIRLGIITVGEGSAQAVCDQMINSGITAIWNFAPCKLSVPQGVLVQNENLALSLAHLNNQLCNFN